MLRHCEVNSTNDEGIAAGLAAATSGHGRASAVRSALSRLVTAHAPACMMRDPLNTQIRKLSGRQWTPTRRRGGNSKTVCAHHTWRVGTHLIDCDGYRGSLHIFNCLQVSRIATLCFPYPMMLFGIRQHIPRSLGGCLLSYRALAVRTAAAKREAHHQRRHAT
jgi:hypothetical protein